MKPALLEHDEPRAEGAVKKERPRARVTGGV